MSDLRTGTVTSADGTVIVFDQSGVGPAVILVQGALMDRADPVMSGVAAGLDPDRAGPGRRTWPGGRQPRRPGRRRGSSLVIIISAHRSA